MKSIVQESETEDGVKESDRFRVMLMDSSPKCKACIILFPASILNRAFAWYHFLQHISHLEAIPI